MATKEEKPADDAAAPAPKKSKKLLIIIVAVVLLLVVVGGAATVLLLKKSDHGDEGEVATEKDDSKKKTAHEAPPVFVPMEPFTVNLIPETGDQYLQVTLSLEAEDPSVGDRLKNFTPKLRNKIMLLLSSKKPSELASREGKEALASDIKDAINEIISEGAAGDKKGDKAPGGVKEVLFTSFIIQ